MKEVELVIQKAMKDGDLHTKNWDLVPPVGAAAAPSSGYYGPSSSSTTTAASFSMPVKKESKKSKKRKQNQNSLLPSNESYYGPASTSAHQTTTSTSRDDDQSSFTHPSYQQQDAGHYYGPSSSSTKSFDSNPDFVPLSGATNATPAKKKMKVRNGFDQSQSTLGNRAKRFSGPGGIAEAASTVKTVSGFDRFMGKGTIGGKDKLDENDYENMKVKGVCQVLEKDYLRLTAPPRPELVRPQHILEQHLRNLKTERTRGNRRDYLWFCSQLKAIRQDCTVQHIKNAFTVDVYETHARVALEEGDLNEYNQCQTQLKELYATLKDDSKAVANRREFLAYRLLYYTFLLFNKKTGSSEIFRIMLSLTPEERKDSAIAHALKVRLAVGEFDYQDFFRLRRNCPFLGGYLMDRIVPGMRHEALLRFCKAYRPSIEAKFVLSVLGFKTEDDSDLAEGYTWLESCGCVLTDDKAIWSTKDSTVHESDMEVKSSLF